MSKGSVKEICLKFLQDDPDVKKILEKIVKEILEEERSYKKTQEKNYSEEIRKLETQNNALMKQIQYQGEISKQEKLELVEKNQKFQRSISQLEDQLYHIQNENAELQKQLEMNKNDQQKLQKQLRDKERQLQTRFGNGYDCFMAFQQLNPACKSRISVFLYHPESFEDFICCLAQVKNLDKIWDVLFDCIMDGEQQNAEILDVLFDYALELVNRTLSEANFVRLETHKGERYDTDFHRLIPNSGNQGLIQEVYLQGYRNIYSQQVLRKSLVSVG